jgi:Ca2+-binding RTX toxin-like protein
VENLTATGAASINLTGNNSNNTIRGNSGANKINGIFGKDTLYGGSGRDIFVFNTKPGASNVDKIMDYKVADDTIHLENAVFT